MCVITLHEDEEGGRRPGNGREGREAAMEGQAGAGLPAFVAWRPASAGERGHGGQMALLLGQRDWQRGFYSALPRHGSGRGTAAPRSVARQSPAPSPVAIPVVATSARCRATMHGAA